jgi:hypothetical protein
LNVVFFTDRDLGLKFSEILKQAGLSVERHSDHFAPGAKDTEWLEAIAKQDWIAITHDQRIRYKPNELRAVLDHGVGLIVVVGDAPYPDLAAAFVAAAPKILEFIEKQKRPFIARFYRPTPGELKKNPAATGRIELWTS